MLNALNKKDCILTPAQLDRILKTYCDIGLQIEVDMLKKRRGILRDDQYNDLAVAVRDHGGAGNFAGFSASLRNLISSGMKMNPARMDPE